jgi:serine/threonine protein kinase
MKSMDNDSQKTTIAPSASDGTIIAPGAVPIQSGSDLTGTILAYKGDVQGTKVAPSSQGTLVASTESINQVQPEERITAQRKEASIPHRLSPGDSVILSGDSYSVDSVVSSGSEAELYVVSRGGVRFAAKLYRPGFSPNSVVLPSLFKISDERIVRSFQSGTASFSGGSAPYELMEYCPFGATSGKAYKGRTAELLEIALQIGKAISVCHESHIIHKDVKPANILIKQEFPVKVCLCDFGIADILKPGQKDIITSQSRTAIYAAPEVYDSDTSIMLDGKTLCKITPSADYYSLGMTLLSLWMGEKSFSSKEEELAFQKRQGRITIPRDMPSVLANVVKGLTDPDAGKRWNYLRLDSELSGLLIPVNGQAGTHGILYDVTNNTIIEDLPSLADYLAASPSHSKEMLYRGQLSDLLSKIDPQISQELTDIVERRYPKSQADGLDAALFILNPDISLSLSGSADHHSSINTEKVRDPESLLSFVKQYPELTVETQRLICSDMFISWLRPRNRQYVTSISRIDRALVKKHCSAVGCSENRVLSSMILREMDQGVPFNWFFTLEGNDKATGKTERNIVVSSPSDFLDFCCSHWEVGPHLYEISSDLFVEWVRYHSSVLADRIGKIDRDGIRRYAQGDSEHIIYRLIIQAMDPLADINLCRDLQDPNFAMTGESIGRVVNGVFNVYYSLFEGSMSAMKDGWSDGRNPLRGMMDFTNARLIVNSFVEKMESHKASYLIGFMKTKGDRFSEQIQWVNYCTDTEPKIGPKYSPATAMIKAVAGLGHVPEYTFFESDVTVCGVDDLKLLDKSLVKKHLIRKDPNGLKGWLALQFQDNPSISFDDEDDHLKSVMSYYRFIGFYNPSDKQVTKCFSDICYSITKPMSENGYLDNLDNLELLFKSPDIIDPIRRLMSLSNEFKIAIPLLSLLNRFRESSETKTILDDIRRVKKYSSQANCEALRKKFWYTIGIFSLISVLLFGLAASSYGESFGQAVAVSSFFTLPMAIIAAVARPKTRAGWIFSMIWPVFIFILEISGGLTVDYNPLFEILWIISIAALYYFGSNIRLQLINATKLSDNTVKALNEIKRSLTQNIEFNNK